MQLVVFMSTLITLILFTLFFNQYVANDAKIPYSLERPITPISLMKKIEHIDVLLIGDSRTKYHLNSALIESSLGQKVFNAGMSGFFFLYWPAMVKQAIHHRVHHIVFSISPADLFNPINLASLESSTTQYGNFQSLKLFLQSRSDHINDITRVFNAALNNSVDFNYTRFYLRNIFQKPLFNTQLECAVHRSLYQDIYDCSNGDGYIISHRSQSPIIPVENSYLNKNLNPFTKFFLTSMIEEAQRHHIHVYIVLIPTYNVKNTLNTTQIASELGVPIIDLSNILMNVNDDRYWAHGDHLSAAGRKVYTEAFLAEVKKKAFIQ